ncbi:hypothetical protein ABIF73_000872 [Bradyrhizobium japonicum]|uniref:hypothetical protein n=1 Tax=Bradyrhizobium japonicum TaxID=375 RepID=UPI00339802BA
MKEAPIDQAETNGWVSAMEAAQARKAAASALRWTRISTLICGITLILVLVQMMR